MSATHHSEAVEAGEEEDAMLEASEVGEEIEDDGDVPMDDDDEDIQEEILLQNDSVAHFSLHTDSIFCLDQHPVHKNLIATGGGDDRGFVWDSDGGRLEKPVLPASYESNPQPPASRESIQAITQLDGHSDSVNAIAFTRPMGQYLLTAGLDGKLRAYTDTSASSTAPGTGFQWSFLAEAQEVEEINWLSPSPSTSNPNTIAFGASDGSVWVYNIDATDKASPLTIVQTFYLHTGPCTAGAWSSDGKLLATVSEDGSLYVWDVFGEAAAAGVTQGQNQTVVSLTAADQRFEVEGGLYSVAIAPNGSFVAVGGAGGHVRIVGLPKIGTAKGAASKGGQKGAAQAGQLLASLQPQSDSVESIAFSKTQNLTLMATASVDGSICLFDYQHNFAVRRHIKDAHAGEAVIKVDFYENSTMLVSCGNDGVVRTWDCRGGTAAAGQGLTKEWKGHRGDGDGGGVLGFVLGIKGTVVTAGDDAVALVFEP